MAEENRDDSKLTSGSTSKSLPISQGQHHNYESSIMKSKILVNENSVQGTHQVENFKVKIMEAIDLLSGMSHTEIEQIAIFWNRIRELIKLVVTFESTERSQQTDICGVVPFKPPKSSKNTTHVSLLNVRMEDGSVGSIETRNKLPSGTIFIDARKNDGREVGENADDLSSLNSSKSREIIHESDSSEGVGYRGGVECTDVSERETNAGSEIVVDVERREVSNVVGVDVISNEYGGAVLLDDVGDQEMVVSETFRIDKSVSDVIEMVADEHGYLVRRNEGEDAGNCGEKGCNTVVRLGHDFSTFDVENTTEICGDLVEAAPDDTGIVRVSKDDRRVGDEIMLGGGNQGATGCETAQRIRRKRRVNPNDSVEILSLENVEEEFADSRDKTIARVQHQDVVNRCDVIGQNATRKSRRILENNITPKLARFMEDEEEYVGEDSGGAPGKRAYHHVQPGDVLCETCGLVGTSRQQMDMHRRTHTGDRPFVCGVCMKAFKTKGNLARHEKTHTGEKPFKCDVCGKAFTEKKSVKVHMREHTGERPFICPICKRGFAQSGILQSHIDMHTGHKGHLCDHCGKSFRQKTHLRLHQRRFLQIRRFACDQCDSSFFSKFELKQHTTKHTGQREFACDHCQQTYTRVQYLRGHLNTFHPRYSCGLCGDGFYDITEYAKHAKARHPGETVSMSARPDAENVTFIYKNDEQKIGEIGTDLTTLVLSQIGGAEDVVMGGNSAAGGGYRVEFVRDGEVTLNQDIVCGLTEVDLSEITSL